MVTQLYYCQVHDTSGSPMKSAARELTENEALEWANLLSCEQWLQGTSVSLYTHNAWKTDPDVEAAIYLDGERLKLCPECKQHKPGDERVEQGMKCTQCAYGVP